MSSNIRIIDPVYFNQNKSAEFRLNEANLAYITSGMYLCLGSHGTNAELNVVKYNRRAGVASVVKAIRLLNGGDVIAQLDNAGQWMAWKGVNKDNADARSKKQEPYAEGSLMHFGIDIGHPDTQQTISNNGDGVALGSLGTTEAESCLGYVPIKDFLKELDVLRALPTAVFDNLRLVVDFTTDILTVCGKLNNGAGALVANLKISQPLLVCDVVSDEETIRAMMAEMKEVAFTCIESDRFVIPAIASGRKTHTQTLRGFNDKIVNRVLLVNSPTDAQLGVQQNHGNGDGTFINSALSSGRLNSLCQNRYTVNCRVNGASVFPGRGLGYDETYGGKTGAGYNHRAGILTDTWGDVSICQGSNTCGLVAQGLYAFGSATEIARNEKILAKNVGHVFYGNDYTGFKLMDRISHLEFSVSRSFVTAANKPFMNAGATNQSIHQIVYAEVPKMLQVANGSYRVSYL